MDMTVKEIKNFIGEIGFDCKLLWILFGRNCQRYIINVTTKRVHWGLEREIIDFEESLSKKNSLGS